MEVKGKVIFIGEVITGEGSNGTWQRQDVVIETDGQYPKKIAIGCMGKVVDSVEQLTEGMELTASINIESREYKGKWFTNVNAWKLDFSTEKKPVSAMNDTLDSDEDDLPF